MTSMAEGGGRARPQASAPAVAPGRGTIIAVASGKGGVGKTWVSLNLAHALVGLGRRVLVFDGDLGLANVDIQLGFTPARDLAAVLGGAAEVGDCAQSYAPGGFDIVAGRSGSGSLAGLDALLLERILAGVQRAAAGYDVVLLDLGAGIERAVRRLAAFADELLVLATEEPTSLTDAYAVLKLFVQDRPGGRARVLVNQSPTRSAGERTYETLRRACAAFLRVEPPLAGVIRRDERVREAIRRQTLLAARFPASPAAADIEQVARTLL